MRARSSLLLLAAFCLPVSARQEPPPSGAVLFEGATVVTDPQTAPLLRGRVIVSDERIVCLSDERGCPFDGDERLDLRGLWIAPGLIDAHAHVELRRAPERALDEQRRRFALGITAVRDAGTDALDELLAEKKVAADPELFRPRLLVTARLAPDEDPWEAVPRLVARGVDGIKLKDPADAQRLEKSVEAARAAGTLISGHTWNGTPPRSFTVEAVRSGVHGVVHLESLPPLAVPPSMLERFPSPDLRAGAFDRWRKGLWAHVELDRLEPLLREMVDRDVWLEPSLAFEYSFGRRLEVSESLRYLAGPPFSVRGWLRSLPARGEGPRFPESYERMEELVLRFHALGGTLVAGSDGVLAGLDLLAEIDLLSRAGLGEVAAWAAATQNAARAVGRADLGTLAAGQTADFVIYRRDPRSSRAGRLSVDRVVKGGVVHDPRPYLAATEKAWQTLDAERWARRWQRLGLLALALLLGVAALFWRRRRS